MALPSRMTTSRLLWPVLLAGTAGATLTYLLDPDAGRRRRHVARDRFLAMCRRGARALERRRRRTAANVYGATQRLRHMHPLDGPAPDDVTLTHTVESEVFRHPAFPKGRINVSAEDGVVVLRGELQQWNQIDDLEARVRKVHGVHDVKNLLHLAGTPAPNKVAARTAGQFAVPRPHPVL